MLLENNQSIYPSIYLHIRLSINIYLSIYLSICLSIYLSIYLSITSVQRLIKPSVVNQSCVGRGPGWRWIHCLPQRDACVCVCFGSKRAACCFDLGLYLFLPDRRLQASFRALQPAWNQRWENACYWRPMGKRCFRHKRAFQIQCWCSKNPTKEQLLIINSINICTVAN